MPRLFLLPFSSLLALLLAACAPPLPRLPEEAPTPSPPLQAASWNDLPGWPDEALAEALAVFRESCKVLEKRPAWHETCAAARGLESPAPEVLRVWFERHFRPWALTNPDGTAEGLITGYYEPIIKGSRKPGPRFPHPVFGPPADLIDVELAGLYPELKPLRLRGRLEGRRLVPYYSRAEWEQEKSKRSPEALLWVSDALDLFFLEIQGSGQVELDDGQRLRLSYADQNGHPYRSIGRWLVERGELTADQASMQGIRGWLARHPERQNELFGVNPSLVFFRLLPVEGSGPPGALGVPLTPERSLAVDPRHVPLGAPIWLATRQPIEGTLLARLMLAQDTGGAIRGVVRADFYWGSGTEAGRRAGAMRHPGRMWLLLPSELRPEEALR